MDCKMVVWQGFVKCVNRLLMGLMCVMLVCMNVFNIVSMVRCLFFIFLVLIFFNLFLDFEFYFKGLNYKFFGYLMFVFVSLLLGKMGLVFMFFGFVMLVYFLFLVYVMSRSLIMKRVFWLVKYVVLLVLYYDGVFKILIFVSSFGMKMLVVLSMVQWQCISLVCIIQFRCLGLVVVYIYLFLVRYCIFYFRCCYIYNILFLL